MNIRIGWLLLLAYLLALLLFGCATPDPWLGYTRVIRDQNERRS